MRLTKRTQIYLSEEQWGRIEREAQAHGVSSAEVVRRAVSAFIAPKEPFATVVKAVAGAWSAMPGSTTDYVNRIREEWHDRRGS